MSEDLTLIDGVRIVVGESYWIKYRHCESPWTKVIITRLTDFGHPWMENCHPHVSRVAGIMTDTYFVEEITPEVELEQFARSWLIDKGFNGFANNSEVPRWFAQMYNDFKRD